jgi:hypothetical protein
MRLRSGKNGVPEGNVVPRLHKCVHAIARTISHWRKLPTKLAPAMRDPKVRNCACRFRVKVRPSALSATSPFISQYQTSEVLVARQRRARKRHRHLSKMSRYSITLSARASSMGGTVRPSALVVLRLMTSSNLVGCSTGKSAGLAPFNILSTKVAARRNKSEISVP